MTLFRQVSVGHFYTLPVGTESLQSPDVEGTLQGRSQGSGTYHMLFTRSQAVKHRNQGGRGQVRF